MSRPFNSDSSASAQPDRYVERFARLAREGKKAFIPFTILGWPDRSTSLEILKTLVDGGSSMLELGLAFSDPMADGPIIQQADQETLNAGLKVDDALQILREIRAYDPEIPIGLLVYYNMVLARGADAFFRDFRAAGADGMLIADLPAECMDEVAEAAQLHNIRLICLVSPLTDPVRLEKIHRYAGGFLYVVSRLGITGVEENYDYTLQSLLARLKTSAQLPLCVGFGISRPDHARRMIDAGADGVVIGSRIIQLLREAPPERRMDTLREWLAEMLAACQTPHTHSRI